MIAKPKARIEVHLAEEGRILVLAGGVAEGWRKFRQGGYGFCEARTLNHD